MVQNELTIETKEYNLIYFLNTKVKFKYIKNFLLYIIGNINIQYKLSKISHG